MKLTATKINACSQQPVIADCATVTCYAVKDEFGRFAGWVLQAQHKFAGGAPEWFAVSASQRCSRYQLKSQRAALVVLAVLFEADMISTTSCVSMSA